LDSALDPRPLELGAGGALDGPVDTATGAMLSGCNESPEETALVWIVEYDRANGDGVMWLAVRARVLGWPGSVLTGMLEDEGRLSSVSSSSSSSS